MDQESRDANSLLVELDRGLQSPHVGDQSEAVVRFSTLFQRYPLPILINSACLKLTAAFKTGSNFIRIQICEVLERNQSHLDKIYNVDEFYRNLFTVTTSNDPIARSITLLALGHIAPIVSDNKSIHHCISNSLESTIECELNASVACAAYFVRHSAEFACNIYPKIVSIIDSDETSNSIKLKALSVLDHGFYNANAAMSVRSFLIDVINKSKLKKLAIACLTLSTKIAHTSLAHITSQIDLLLTTFQEDSRQVIKISALHNLFFLAEKSPHMWESTHILPILSFLEESNTREQHDAIISRSILSIFLKLLNCKCNFIAQQEKNRIFQLCYKLALLGDYNTTLSLVAFELLTVMSEEHYYSMTKDNIEFQDDDDITSSTFKAIKIFLDSQTKPRQSATDDTRERRHLDLATKAVYRHIVKLGSLDSRQCSELLTHLFTKFTAKNFIMNDLTPHYTELMCAILPHANEDQFVTPRKCFKVIKTRAGEMSDTNLLNLCVLYFQTLRLEADKVPLDFIDLIARDRSLWFVFKVMRQAMRYGHFQLGNQICKRLLHDHVTTDTMDFYFKALTKICEAETVLSQEHQNLDNNLKSAIPMYEDAVSPLRASIGNSRTTNFQLEFLSLRIRILQAHGALRQCCKIYETLPITYANLLNAISTGRGNDQGVTKFSIVQQLPKIANDFRYLGDCYDNLSVVSFNCDNRTLEYIYLLKASCIIMSDVIDAIFQYGKNLPVINKLSIDRDKDLALEHRHLEKTCNRLIERIRTDILKPGLFPSQKSIEPIIDLIKGFSDEILLCPFIYPRYFFQPLQKTHIKLALTPQPSTPFGNLSYMVNNNLMLKVEGIIQNPSKIHKIIRHISKVVVGITMKSVVNSDTNQYTESTASPHNNYFKTEFLLSLKQAGTFVIEVNVMIVDEQERQWKTGPTERLNVVVSSG